jgi:hypothetical protein
MIRTFLTLTFLSLLFSACAQTRTGIQKAHAFFKVSIPGNIPVDEQGNPMKRDDTVRVIYMECSGAAKPEINEVLYPGKAYTASVFEEKSSVQVGNENYNNSPLSVKPAKGNTLWRVELTPSGAKKTPRTNKIIIKGARNGRTFSQVIEGETQLASPIHM